MTLSDNTAEKILASAQSANLETIRFLFPDQHGILRGKSVVASKLGSTLKDGVKAPSTILLKDTSQRTVFPVWEADAGFGRGALVGSGDIHLKPDLDTFRILPWANNTGLILCDIENKNGDPIGFTPREVLRNAIQQLSDAGYQMLCGLEVEFHVFQLNELQTTDAGMPAPAPSVSEIDHDNPPDVSHLTRHYELLGDAKYDAMSGIIDLLRKMCEQMGLSIQGVETEFGPSQFEFVFDPADPLTQADNMVLFRSMVKQVCARHGYHASFMCKPKVEACAASGWHLHQSIIDIATGKNAFMSSDDSLNDIASAWIAGLLVHAEESCLITTPTINGYKRYSVGQLAPNRIQWANDNRGAMIRSLIAKDDPASRVENRIAEPAANPYYVFASQILSGLSGMKQGLKAPHPVEEPYNTDATLLPSSMLDALNAFRSGSLYKDMIGEDFSYFYAHLKQAEWDRYLSEVSEWEHREYFSLF